MDTKTGRILDANNPEEQGIIDKLAKKQPGRVKPMVLAPTEKQMHRRPYPKIGRNDPCPCGSGIKFKRCCLMKSQ